MRNEALDAADACQGRPRVTIPNKKVIVSLPKRFVIKIAFLWSCGAGMVVVLQINLGLGAARRIA